MWHIDDPITWNEFNQANNGINSMKAVIFYGVPQESFKDMENYFIRYVFELIAVFWHARDDFKS